MDKSLSAAIEDAVYLILYLGFWLLLVVLILRALVWIVRKLR